MDELFARVGPVLCNLVAMFFLWRAQQTEMRRANQDEAAVNKQIAKLESAEKSIEQIRIDVSLCVKRGEFDSLMKEMHSISVSVAGIEGFLRGGAKEHA